MAPPVYAELSRITGDRKYLDFMEEEFLSSTNYLFDRKKTYFDQKKLAQWYEENERAISEIQEKLWEIPGDELLQKALKQELERRRQARVYSADVLGYDTEAAEAQSEYEREQRC